MFGVHMRPGPGAAQAVQRRDAAGCREIAVRAAAARLLWQVEPDLGRKRLGVAMQRRNLRRLGEGRTVHSARHADPASRVAGRKAEQPALHLHPVLGPRHPQVDLAACFGRDYVGPGAAPDRRRVQRDPAVEVHHGVDRLDLMRQLHHRRGALLERAARMGAAPLHPQGEPAHALARRDAGPACAGGLHDQHRARLRRFAFDQIAAGRAAHLLVRRQQQHHRPGRRDALAQHGPQHMHGEETTRLHVVDTGAGRPRAVDPRRHPLQRTMLPNRVQMPGHHDRLTAALRACHQIVAEPVAAGNALDRDTCPCQLPLGNVHQSVNRLRVRRGAFDMHPRQQFLDQVFRASHLGFRHQHVSCGRSLCLRRKQGAVHATQSGAARSAPARNRTRWKLLA
jgi:hypothetical protein